MTKAAELVREALGRRSLDNPTAVFGSPDPMVGRMLGALTATLADLRTRYPFRDLPPFIEGGDDRPTGDDDVITIDREAVLLGTLWRFCEMTGLDYAEDMASHEARVARLACEATKAAGNAKVAT